jgi:fatty-acyl-CoA synthase
VTPIRRLKTIQMLSFGSSSCPYIMRASIEHPAVAEAAVFGVPDPKYVDEVSAAVVLRGTATAQELQVYCRTRLADFKVPKLIHFVSVIPRNAIGKVQRRDLTALFKAAPG